MKLRKSKWFNVEEMKEKYGIEIHHNGKWLNAAEGNELLLFDLEKERDEKLQKLIDEVKS